jgi:hypothetical protein
VKKTNVIEDVVNVDKFVKETLDLWALEASHLYDAIDKVVCARIANSRPRPLKIHPLWNRNLR